MGREEEQEGYGVTLVPLFSFLRLRKWGAQYSCFNTVAVASFAPFRKWCEEEEEEGGGGEGRETSFVI